MRLTSVSRGLAGLLRQNPRVVKKYYNYKRKEAIRKNVLLNTTLKQSNCGLKNEYTGLV